jgi:group I intron endonuclease
MKQYIGSSFDIQARLAGHKYGHNSSPRLQLAIKKYGLKNFQFDILEKCIPKYNVSTEQYYLDLYRPEYNIARTAGSTRGIHFSLSEEARKKISNASLGNRRRLGMSNSPIHRKRISVAKMKHFVSGETKEKIRQANFGNKNALGHFQIPWNKEKHLSEETKTKLSIKKLGNKNALGHICTEEAKNKMSEARRRYLEGRDL